MKSLCVGIAVVLLMCVSGCQGWASYQSSFPNGAKVMSGGSLWGGVGHSARAGGGTLNQFGAAFKAAGYTWTPALCAADSDNDGQTNGFELGDPNCVWSAGKAPSRTTDISHPGVATSMAATPAPLPPTPAPTPLPPGQTAAPTNATTAVPETTTTTAEPTTTAAATPQPPTLFATTAIDAGLGGFMSVSWSIFSNSTATAARRAATSGDLMDLTMTFTATASEQWGGIGFATTGMVGPLVIGYVDANGNGQVSEWTGSASSVSPRSGSSTVVSASVDGASGTRTLVLRIPLEEVGVSNSDFRTIFAKGPWAGGNPSKHDTTAKKTVNFYTGATKTLENAKQATILGLIIAVVVVIVMTAIGGIFNCAGVCFGPTASKILWFLSFLIVALMIILVIVMSHSDYSNAGQTAPIGRALGDGASYCFFLVLWPTTKHIGPARVMGISYERFLLPHLILGMLTFILMTAHFGILYDSMAKSDPAAARKVTFEWGESDGGAKRPILPGFISWVLLVLMVIPAIFLRRVAFSFFRTMHLLFLFVIVFGALHHWPLWILIAPGLLSWFVDVIIRLVVMSKNEASYASSEYHAEAGVTALCIKVSPEFDLLPGAYAFLTLDPLGGWAHPFSVAAVDREKNEARFYIKNMGKGTFTERLANAAADKKLGPSVMLLGPYGSLNIPLTKPNHVILCCGGIGITPMMSTLQYIGERLQVGELAQLQTIKFVWTVQSRPVFDVVLPDLDRAGQMILAASGGKVTLEGFVCVTRSQFEMSPSWFTIVPGRPTYSKYITKSPAHGEITAVYACGPAPMMDDVSTATGAAGALLHTETFEF